MPVIGTPIDTGTPTGLNVAAAGWSVTVAPTYRPVSADDVRAQLRIDNNDPTSDARIGLMIDAATDYAEDAMSVVLAARTITAIIDNTRPIVLPRGPLISIVSVKDVNNVTTTAYTLARIGYRVSVRPSVSLTGPITIVYRAGFTLADGTESAAAIPAGIRQSILMHAGTFWEARESTTDKPRAAVPHGLDAFYKRKNRALGVG